MTKENQDFHQIDDRNPFNSYQDKHKDKKNNNYTLKKDYKNSIAHWQCKKKVNKLIKSLQYKT